MLMELLLQDLDRFEQLLVLALCQPRSRQDFLGLREQSQRPSW